jgi:large subunit ribosomal protein L22
MSKPKRERPLADNEAMAMARTLRTSPQKLNLLCQQIQGKSAETALAELSFSKRRIAGAVKKVLESAIANAENNHQLDVDRLYVAEADRLYVAEASVGRAFVMKRFRARARGRIGRIQKPWSRLRVVVREREEQA